MWWQRLRSVAVVVIIAGCTTMASFDVERDMGVHTLWAKRGQTLGDLAHIYCEQGGPRERETMEWAISRSSYPATVTITCPSAKEH